MYTYPRFPAAQPEPERHIDKGKLALGGLTAAGGFVALAEGGFISAEWARIFAFLFGVGSLLYAGVLVYSALGLGPAQPQPAQ